MVSENFGFNKKGITQQSLVQKPYNFLRDVYQGQIAMPTPGVVCAQLNPHEILAIGAGFTKSARSFNYRIILPLRTEDTVAAETVANVYNQLIKEAYVSHGGALRKVESDAVKTGVNNFPRRGRSLTDRLNAVFEMHPELVASIADDVDSITGTINSGMKFIHDPNCDARNKGPSNKRIYARDLTLMIGTEFEKYQCSPDAYLAQAVKAISEGNIQLVDELMTDRLPIMLESYDDNHPLVRRYNALQGRKVTEVFVAQPKTAPKRRQRKLFE